MISHCIALYQEKSKKVEDKMELNGIAKTIRSRMRQEISNNGTENYHRINVEITASKSQLKDAEDYLFASLPLNYHVAIRGKDKKYEIIAWIDKK